MPDQPPDYRPPGTRLAVPAPRDDLVLRRQSIARRPPWHLVVRTAGYGMVLFVIWVVLTILFPNVFTRSSDRAIVDSPVMLVTSPVDGIVTREQVMTGKPFAANQPLMTVRNPNVDRTLLVELTGKALDNQQHYDAARAQLAGDESQLAATDRDRRRYRAASQREHAATIHALQARLAVAQAQVDQQKDVVDRNEAMQSAGAVSAAYTNASRYQLAILSNSKAAAAAELDHAKVDGNSPGGSPNASPTDGSVEALDQRDRLLSADVVQLKAAMAQFASYAQSVNKMIYAEDNRLERLSNVEVHSDEPGVVEDVLAPPGTRVSAGSTLVRAHNCGQSRIVAVFPRGMSDDLLPGSHLNVRLDGVPFSLPASVAKVLPRASEGEQARYFVPFPPIEKNEIYVIAKLDRPLSSLPAAARVDPTGRCAMGHWAKVSVGQGWFGGSSTEWAAAPSGTSWHDRLQPIADRARRRLYYLGAAIGRGLHWLKNAWSQT